MITRFATLCIANAVFLSRLSAPYEINFSPTLITLHDACADFRQIEGEHFTLAGESTRNGYQLELSSEQEPCLSPEMPFPPMENRS